MSLSYFPRIVTGEMILFVDPANKKSYSDPSLNVYNLANTAYNGLMNTQVQFDSSGPISFQFNADSKHIYFADTQPITNDFTHVAWVKRNGDTASGIGGIFGNLYHTELAGANMYFRNATNYIQFAAGNGVTRPYHTLYPPRTTMAWNFYAIRYIGTTYSVFFNGELLDSRTAVVVQSAGTKRFIIGRWAPSYSGYYLNANVGPCMSYRRGLTDQEIKQNFNAFRGRYGL